ncbi:MAG: DUF4388 domain-containing protein [Polyangiales bacterium]
MSAPVLTGSITSGGALEILHAIELRRTTGVLRFKGAEVEGDVQLVAGQIALDQVESSGGRDPVEVLLELREGSYEVYQRIPPLAVSRGDDQHRSGNLGVHVPADLMTFCERMGLTGLLLFAEKGREAQMIYDAGELRAIAVDGEFDADVHDVFGWSEGTFEVVAYAVAPPTEVNAMLAEPSADVLPGRDPTFPRIRRRGDATGEFPFRVGEIRVTALQYEREKRRADERKKPDSLPAARPSSQPGSGVTEERPATVQIVFLGVPEDRERRRSETRHAQGGVAAETELPNAVEGRRAVPGSANVLETGAWVVFAFSLFLAILALLARVPDLK